MHRITNTDLAVIAFAVKEFGLPSNLKLSVHSGSDKFSIYSPINKAIKKFDAPKDSPVQVQKLRTELDKLKEQYQKLEKQIQSLKKPAPRKSR